MSSLIKATVLMHLIGATLDIFFAREQDYCKNYKIRGCYSVIKKM